MVLVTLAIAANPSFQAKDPEPIVNAWTLMLPDIPFVIAMTAVIKVCRASRFFPSVAEIVEAAHDLDPRNEKLPTAAEAWEEVGKLIVNVGPYRECQITAATQSAGQRNPSVGCSFAPATIRKRTGHTF